MSKQCTWIYVTGHCWFFITSAPKTSRWHVMEQVDTRESSVSIWCEPSAWKIVRLSPLIKQSSQEICYLSTRMNHSQHSLRVHCYAPKQPISTGDYRPSRLLKRVIFFNSVLEQASQRTVGRFISVLNQDSQHLKFSISPRMRQRTQEVYYLSSCMSQSEQKIGISALEQANKHTVGRFILVLEQASQLRNFVSSVLIRAIRHRRFVSQQLCGPIRTWDFWSQ